MTKAQGLQTPNFDRLIRDGVTVDGGGMINAFVTKTLPNHYSIVTGLYPENHGIVGNTFFDPLFNETFAYGLDPDTEERKWWDGLSGVRHGGAEPIWVTNDRTGNGRTSGSYRWPGSVVDQQRPYYTRCNVKSASTVKKNDFLIGVKTIVEWFTDSVRPINLGLLYFGEPDHTGHLEGAGTMAVLEKIVELDEVLGNLLDSLESKSLLDRMNIILTSDHGMVNVTKTVFLDEYVDSKLYTYSGQSPIWNIQPLPGQEDSVFKAFQAIPDFTIFKAEEFPEELRYGKNRRYGLLSYILLAREGINFCQSNNSLCHVLKGYHGYNNSLPSMHPIFIAHGPAFKRNYASKPFNNVDLYSLMCHILGLTGHSNDGNLQNIRQILKEDELIETHLADRRTLITVLISLGSAALVSVVCCIGVARTAFLYRRRKYHCGIRRLSPDCLDLVEKNAETVRPLLDSEEEESA